MTIMILIIIMKYAWPGAGTIARDSRDQPRVRTIIVIVLILIMIRVVIVVVVVVVAAAVVVVVVVVAVVVMMIIVAMTVITLIAIVSMFCLLSSHLLFYFICFAHDCITCIYISLIFLYYHISHVFVTPITAILRTLPVSFCFSCNTIRLLCHTSGMSMSAASAVLLCHKASMSAASRARRVCGATKPTCLKNFRPEWPAASA